MNETSDGCFIYTAHEVQLSTVTCKCGFTATGPSQTDNLAAYEEHRCVTGTLESIFDSVFSIPGIVIAWIIAAVITHTF